MSEENPDGESSLNCVSHALHKIGLAGEGKEQRGFTPTLEELLEKTEEVPVDDADVIAVVHKKAGIIIHLAALDKTKPGYVDQRAGVGEDPESVTVEEALAPYRDEDGTNNFLYLKVRKD